MKKYYSPLQKHFLVLLCGALGLLFTGCASIVGKTRYPVTISSNPPGAHYVVKKENGVVISKGITPNVVILSSSFGFADGARYIVDFDRNGVQQSFPLEGHLNYWYLANFISWGIPGLLVDPITGAMWKLDDTIMASFPEACSNTTSIK
jgi:hypothetical protein